MPMSKHCQEKSALLTFSSFEFQQMNDTSDYGSLNRSWSIEDNENVPLGALDYNNIRRDVPPYVTRSAHDISDEVYKNNWQSIAAKYSFSQGFLHSMSSDDISDTEPLQLPLITFDVQSRSADAPIHDSPHKSWEKFPPHVSGGLEPHRRDHAPSDKLWEDMSPKHVPHEASKTASPDQRGFDQNWGELKSAMEYTRAHPSDSRYQFEW